MMRWQPISTAPKDGSDFWARIGLGAPFKCFYQDGHVIHESEHYGWIYYEGITHWAPIDAEAARGK